MEAGILRRGETADEASDLYGSQLRAFFGGYRAVFPIDGPSEEIVGFAARALGEEKPKYLYSFDFPRRTTLYGEGRLLRILRKYGRSVGPSTVDVYLVEGIFDVLRFEQLGLHALGVLGAQLTPGQIARIRKLQDIVAESGRDLRIHLFLDSDDAGRRGTYDACLQLLQLLTQAPPLIFGWLHQ